MKCNESSATGPDQEPADCRVTGRQAKHCDATAAAALLLTIGGVQRESISQQLVCCSMAEQASAAAATKQERTRKERERKNLFLLYLSSTISVANGKPVSVGSIYFWPSGAGELLVITK